MNGDNFKKALKQYWELGLEHTIQDYHYFDSVYTKDPGVHTVELTTLKFSEKVFYK